MTLKEQSYYNSLLFIANWSLIKELKIKNINLPLKNTIFINWIKIEKNSKDYFFIEKWIKNMKKNILDSDFPDKIKEIWLNFYDFRKISLTKYKEFLEMLKWEPFNWNKKNFIFDDSKINNENLLDELMEIHSKITEKMYLELKK